MSLSHLSDQVSYSPVTYGDYSYPQWAEMLGLCLSLASMVWVPLYALYYLTCKEVRSCHNIRVTMRCVFHQSGSFSERLRAGLTPMVDSPGDKGSVSSPSLAIPSESFTSLDTTITDPGAVSTNL